MGDTVGPAGIPGPQSGQPLHHGPLRHVAERWLQWSLALTLGVGLAFPRLDGNGLSPANMNLFDGVGTTPHPHKMRKVRPKLRPRRI